MNLKQYGKLSQPLMIAILIALTALVSLIIWLNKQETRTAEHGHEDEHTGDGEAEAHATEEHVKEKEGEIKLTARQMAEQGLKVAIATTGPVEEVTLLPGKLVVNTDQQAHVSPSFTGHVEQVKVSLGQSVQKGQTLAVLLVPELIDQQANLRMAQATLQLAKQDYQREQQLWTQGISAKQDYQRAENAYRQAQLAVQASQARLNALGASSNTHGRFVIRAPISGVISQKDIVVGENVQLADQIFVIEQLNNLWLEFTLPAQYAGPIQAGQKVLFKLMGTEQTYSARIQSLTSQADSQTGRLIVRAKLDTQSASLRPNVLVSVLMAKPAAKTSLRVKKAAVQRIEGEDTVFILQSEEKGQVHLKAQQVKLGQASGDGEWLEVISGLADGEKYISEGSFLLKSELEKDEAGHEH